MKQKLEFPLFYLLWVAACMELVLSLGKDNAHLIITVGLLLLCSTFSFVWANSGKDDIICILLKPILVMLGAAVLISMVISRTPLMLCVVGVQFICLWNVERGYAYEHAYES